MSDIRFHKILWNNREGHDKVWCSFVINDMMYCAWGRRGARLQFKEHGTYNTWVVARVKKLECEKQEKKGYTEVDKFLLFSIFPDFETKVEEELVVKILAGKVL